MNCVYVSADTYTTYITSILSAYYFNVARSFDGVALDSFNGFPVKAKNIGKYEIFPLTNSNQFEMFTYCSQ